MKSLKGKDLLCLSDLTSKQVEWLLDLADRVKKHPREWSQSLPGLQIAMLFEKPSLRTRFTFEAGIRQLGGGAIYSGPAESGKLGEREPIPDVARNLERWVQGIVARVFGHDKVEGLAKAARIPVINALSDFEHPCQVLADLQTLRERWGKLAGRRLAWVGDGNNVCHSLLHGAALTGVHLAVATPKGHGPSRSVVKAAMKSAKKRRSTILVTNDPVEAVKGAEAVYTDVWASMGQEAQAAAKARSFRPYQVNGKLLRHAAKNALFLHCLPAHRGEEVTTDVLEGKNSVILDEAENRLHAQKALMLALFGAA